MQFEKYLICKNKQKEKIIKMPDCITSVLKGHSHQHHPKENEETFPPNGK